MPKSWPNRLKDENLEEEEEEGNKRELNLDGNGRDMTMILGNDDIVSQNDDVVLDFLGYALGAGGGKIQPYGVTHRRITQSPQ